MIHSFSQFVEQVRVCTPVDYGTTPYLPLGEDGVYNFYTLAYSTENEFIFPYQNNQVLSFNKLTEDFTWISQNAQSKTNAHNFFSPAASFGEVGRVFVFPKNGNYLIGCHNIHQFSVFDRCNDVYAVKNTSLPARPTTIQYAGVLGNRIFLQSGLNFNKSFDVYDTRNLEWVGTTTPWVDSMALFGNGVSDGEYLYFLSDECRIVKVDYSGNRVFYSNPAVHLGVSGGASNTITRTDCSTICYLEGKIYFSVLPSNSYPMTAIIAEYDIAGDSFSYYDTNEFFVDRHLFYIWRNGADLKYLTIRNSSVYDSTYYNTTPSNFSSYGSDYFFIRTLDTSKRVYNLFAETDTLPHAYVKTVATMPYSTVGIYSSYNYNSTLYYLSRDIDSLNYKLSSFNPATGVTVLNEDVGPSYTHGIAYNPANSTIEIFNRSHDVSASFNASIANTGTIALINALTNVTFDIYSNSGDFAGSFSENLPYGTFAVNGSGDRIISNARYSITSGAITTFYAHANTYYYDSAWNSISSSLNIPWFTSQFQASSSYRGSINYAHGFLLANYGVATDRSAWGDRIFPTLSSSWFGVTYPTTGTILDGNIYIAAYDSVRRQSYVFVVDADTFLPVAQFDTDKRIIPFKDEGQATTTASTPLYVPHLGAVASVDGLGVETFYSIVGHGFAIPAKRNDYFTTDVADVFRRSAYSDASISFFYNTAAPPNYYPTRKSYCNNSDSTVLYIASGLVSRSNDTVDYRSMTAYWDTDSEAFILSNRWVENSIPLEFSNYPIVPYVSSDKVILGKGYPTSPSSYFFSYPFNSPFNEAVTTSPQFSMFINFNNSYYEVFDSDRSAIRREADSPDYTFASVPTGTIFEDSTVLNEMVFDLDPVSNQVYFLYRDMATAVTNVTTRCTWRIKRAQSDFGLVIGQPKIRIFDVSSSPFLLPYSESVSCCYHNGSLYFFLALSPGVVQYNINTDTWSRKSIGDTPIWNKSTNPTTRFQGGLTRVYSKSGQLKVCYFDNRLNNTTFREDVSGRWDIISPINDFNVPAFVDFPTHAPSLLFRQHRNYGGQAYVLNHLVADLRSSVVWRFDTVQELWAVVSFSNLGFPLHVIPSFGDPFLIKGGDLHLYNGGANNPAVSTSSGFEVGPAQFSTSFLNHKAFIGFDASDALIYQETNRVFFYKKATPASAPTTLLNLGVGITSAKYISNVEVDPMDSNIHYFFELSTTGGYVYRVDSVANTVTSIGPQMLSTLGLSLAATVRNCAISLFENKIFILSAATNKIVVFDLGTSTYSMLDVSSPSALSIATLSPTPDLSQSPALPFIVYRKAGVLKMMFVCFGTIGGGKTQILTIDE